MIKRKRSDYDGLLIIGDPHLEGRVPGFRKDDFPNVILKKIRWCLTYARRNGLLPAFLGDIFDKPRDNPTWMVGALIEMLNDVPSIAIYGNHDCAETVLSDNDSLSILVKSGCLQLVDEANPWIGKMSGRNVYVGGSSYRQTIPDKFELQAPVQSNFFDGDPLVVWLTHHDIDFSGYDGGRFSPFAIDGVNYVINGHIHRRLDSIRRGKTLWMNPGNICRRSRSDANRDHVPRAVQIDVHQENESFSDVVIPHQPFNDVFHEEIMEFVEHNQESEFVAGLAELIARRTESGAGLHHFLKENMDQFEPAVANEILQLAHQVTENEETQHAKV